MSQKPYPKNSSVELPGCKIGYARVSTDDQSLDLQIDALKESGCEIIYEEKISGKNIERPELAQCLKALRSGDVLVVWKLDRLGRSLKDLIAIVELLRNKGVGFESVTEKLDTTSSMGQLLFHFFAAISEFERGLIKERTLAGLVAARKKGRVGGRPLAMEPSKREHASELIKAGISIRKVSEILGVSKSTLYRQLNSLNPLTK
jgi:DNA invertase Pin-like site-specific DNA recombinase